MLDIFVHSARNLKDVNAEEVGLAFLRLVMRQRLAADQLATLQVTDLGEHKDYFMLYGAIFCAALYFGLSLWYFTSPGVIAHASGSALGSGQSVHLYLGLILCGPYHRC